MSAALLLSGPTELDSAPPGGWQQKPRHPKGGQLPPLGGAFGQYSPGTGRIGVLARKCP